MALLRRRLRACRVCREDEVFDRSARHPAAAARVGICREPYVLDVCDHHLAAVRDALPAGGLWVIALYDRQAEPA